MREIRQDRGRFELSASIDELRLIVATMNEALNGAYAIPADEWPGLIGQTPERADALMDELADIIERHDGPRR